MARAFQRTVSVAGLNKMDTTYDWDDLEFFNTDDFAIEREPKNRHDKNAIAFKLRGKIIGYVPKPVAKELAPLLDKGWRADGELKSNEEFCEDDGREYSIVKFQIYAIPPDASSDQIEKFNGYQEYRTNEMKKRKRMREERQKEMERKRREQEEAARIAEEKKLSNRIKRLFKR